MAEMCLRSLKAACHGLRFKIYAILDGCPSQYSDLFASVFLQDELEVLSVDSIGNHGTFKLQVDLLSAQTEADYVYFAEDDYFYLPGALSEMLEFMCDNRDADFITPYDHPDSYYTSSRFERHIIRPYGKRYWRHASSTCLTFLTTKEVLLRTRWILETYSKGNFDCSIWLALTQKYELMDPRVHGKDRYRVKLWLWTLWWGWRQIFFGRRYSLWCPIPSVSTHMESTCLAPLLDWQTLFGKSADA
jgi:hypothetical protein